MRGEWVNGFGLVALLLASSSVTLALLASLVSAEVELEEEVQEGDQDERGEEEGVEGSVAVVTQEVDSDRPRSESSEIEHELDDLEDSEVSLPPGLDVEGG